MSDLKNSIMALFAYIMLVLGIAQVQFIEDNVLDFTPLFFVLFAAAILIELFFVGVLLRRGARISLYTVLFVWPIVYGLVWFFYWRSGRPISIQIHLLQFIILELAAAAAYEVSMV
jgi:hypothetical protein